MFYVMGTGSRKMVVREDRAEIYALLEYKISLLLEEYPDLHLISGMAEGWDEAIAKVGMRRNIPYSCYIPHRTYGDYYWGRKSLTGKNRIATFNEIVEAAADVQFICQDLYEYINGKRVHANFIRNDAMVERADLALAYIPEGHFSPGTNHALGLLHRKRTEVQMYPFES
jgi:hypothetical protein